MRPAPGSARVLVALGGAGVLLLLAGCSSAPSAAVEATTPVTATASSSTTGSPTSSVRPTGPLSVSTPVAPSSTVDGAAGGEPGGAPAQAGRDGPTQRHPFVPTSLTLNPQGGPSSTAPVEKTDTTSSGELGLPANPGQVGWWQSGALAGDLYGSVVLAGHVDSRDYGVGFFLRLLHVRVGDEVVLDDGTYQQPYRVVSTRSVPKASLATGTDTFSQTVPGRLVLLTCSGTWSPATHYPDNFIVTAEPIGAPTPRG